MGTIKTLSRELGTRNPYFVDYENFDQEVNSYLDLGWNLLALSHCNDEENGSITITVSLFLEE